MGWEIDEIKGGSVAEAKQLAKKKRVRRKRTASRKRRRA